MDWRARVQRILFQSLRFVHLCLAAVALVCAVPAAAETFRAPYEPLNSCAELIRAVPDAPCSLLLKGFRRPDLRAGVIEMLGASKSGLFPGQVHRISSAVEATRLRGKLQPGDQVVLTNGVWRDQTLVIEGEGTPDKPILVRPEKAGGTVLTGTSSAYVSGSNIILDDLMFREGRIDRPGFTVLHLGSGEQKPCHNCIANRITIDDYNAIPGRDDHVKVFYVQIHGRDITISHSRFLNKRTQGTMISPNLPPVSQACPQTLEQAASCFQRFHFLNNRVSNMAPDPNGKDVGERKVMQLGWSGMAGHSAFARIEGNTFDHILGDNELLSLKASDVIVRNNSFIANAGVVNLRAANRVLVENNSFDGKGQPGMGGVRIEGKGHILRHNAFCNLTAPKNHYYWPISIHAAKDEELRNGIEDYARAKDIVIVDNVFSNAGPKPIMIGIFPDAAHGRTLMPDNIFVIGNSLLMTAKKKANSIGMLEGQELSLSQFVGEQTQYHHVFNQRNVVKILPQQTEANLACD